MIHCLLLRFGDSDLSLGLAQLVVAMIPKEPSLKTLDVAYILRALHNALIPAVRLHPGTTCPA